ncbi:MAG: right-handed parallel beta-helix repeat-containing protein [Planctomycetota bacterium]
MHNSKNWFVRLCCAGTALFITAQSFAGDVNPPVGPVVGTMKPLSEIEPRIVVNATNTPGDIDSQFKIVNPGSYYLASNITGASGLIGIEVAAADVTLDLMGHEMLGVPGSLQGIRVTLANSINIAIQNGTVRLWGGAGVDIVSATSKQLRQLRVAGNGVGGITAGANALITDCHSTLNTGAGITTGTGGTITNCTVVSNTTLGITTNIANTVTNCTAMFNTTDGISVGQGSTVTACTSRGNSGHGIVGQPGSTIQNNTSSANVGDGIRVSTDCRVANNTCDGNGAVAGDAAGIHATSDDNRIDSNHVTDNDRGIDVDVGGNLVIRNSASGNGADYDIVAGNSKAEILTGGDDFIATNPWANFSF